MSDVVYLECVEDGSSKFWSGTVKGKVLTTRWGKIGTQGQSKEETFADVAAAKASLDKQAAAKTKKGYTAAAGAPAAARTPAKSSPRVAKAAPPAAKAIKPRSAPTKSPVPTTKPLLTAWLKDTSRTGAELASAEGRFPETDRLIAAHTLALPETLSKLSHGSDKATRAKVAANPNAPPADYVRLGQQFPDEFLSNPGLDLLVLENPGLLPALPEALLLRVLKRDACPADFLVWAAALPSEKAQLAVAMNADAPAQALERLRQSAHATVRDAVSSAGTAIKGDPETLFRDAVRERLGVLPPEEAQSAWWDDDIGLPQFPFLSVQARMRIAHLDDYHRWELNGPSRVRRALAGNPNAAVALLAILVKDEDEGVRSLAAKNPNTPVASLELLAMDKHKDIRCSVACNPSTSVTLLEMLAKDTEQNVRCSVGSNPNTPFAVLNALGNDADPWVSLWVAENPQTPVDFAHHLLSALALRKGEKNLKLRCKVALSPRTPVSFLDRLANDREYEVRGSVAKNSMSVALLDVLAKDDVQRVRSAVAENPYTSVALLEVLAKDKEEEVRSSVAQNPNTPIAVLEALAKDKKSQVRSSVAQNPNTPVAVLGALSTDKNEDVRSSVAQNLSTPVEVLEALSKEKVEDVRCSVAGNPNTPAVVLGALAKDKYLWVRSSVAANPNTPVALLEALAKDKDGEVRSAVAENPNAPVTLLGRMIELDQEERVRQVSDLQSSPWITKELASASKECRAAFDHGDFLHFRGKDPNRTVLSRRPLGVLMALCGGPFVEPSRIARVAGSGDWLIRAAVARNRGVPPNLRTKLASDAHPLVRALAIAADVPAVTTAPSAHRAYVFPQKRVVRELTGLLKGIDGVWFKIRLACDHATPKPILAALGKDRYAHVRFSVAGNSRTPVSTLDALANDKDTSEWDVSEDTREVFDFYGLSFCRKSDIRRNSKVGRLPSSLQGLLSAESWYRRSVARNPNTTGVFLETLAKDKDEDVRCAVADNPSTPVALLEALAQDKGKAVRRAVAKNPNTPGVVLEALAKDPDQGWFSVQNSVVNNPNTPVAVLEALAKHKDKDVRAAVARNPSAPVALLETLATDEDPYVRRSVGGNRNTPLVVLESLAMDKDVRASVAQNPNTPVPLEVLAKDKDKDVRQSVAGNPRSPAAVLEALAKDPDGGSFFSVRAQVAQNPNTPVAVIEALAKDVDENVRKSLAGCPHTPVSILDALTKDKSVEVREELARNPNTPVQLRGVLAKDKTKKVREAVAGWLSESRLRGADPAKAESAELSEQEKEIMTLMGIATEPRFPESSLHFWLSVLTGFPMNPDNKALTKASRDTHWLLRLGAALHPASSNAMLELLSGDTDNDVAGAARMKLAERKS
jgi:predicted DNA-binding WGR domain protein/pentose-5-phosphate-3-epimerase